MAATTTDEPATSHRQRRWGTASARVRILGWVALLLALAGAAALLLQRRVLLERLDDEVDRSLEQEVEEVRVLAEGTDPSSGEPFAGDVSAIFDTFLRRNIPPEGETLLTFVDGAAFLATSGPYSLGEDPSLVARWSALDVADRGEIETPAGPVRFLAVPLSDGGTTRGVFVVANFLRGERAEIDRTTQVGAIVYGSVLVVAIGLAWLVAGRLLAPVRAITAAARRMDSADLSGRIPVPDSRDEIAELAWTYNALLDRLESAFAHQRDFLNDAGHELRTPITIIRGHLELESDDPADRRETRRVVFDELDRMARFVDDLLVLARSEQPDFLRREAFDLDVLTAEIAAKAEALADRRWVLAATGHGIVTADRQRLTQAVINLCGNAVNHTHPGNRIELGSAIVDGTCRIWVADDGPGVPAQDRERIFERFARGSEETRQGGAGLGLAIVRAIAEAHGGRVDLVSGHGSGARFDITLPVVDDATTEELDVDDGPLTPIRPARSARPKPADRPHQESTRASHPYR